MYYIQYTEHLDGLHNTRPCVIRKQKDDDYHDSTISTATAISDGQVAEPGYHRGRVSPHVSHTEIQ